MNIDIDMDTEINTHPVTGATHRLVAQSRIDSPLGPLTLATTARGLALVWFDRQQHRTDSVDAPLQPGHPLLQQAESEFAAYWGDARHAFTLPLDPRGTAFQQAVWQVLRGIAAGALLSYGEVARRMGRPSAGRAVGAAIGRNPLGIVVPCHRVVGSSGALTGYAGGLPRKQALLRHEGAQAGLVLAAEAERAPAPAALPGTRAGARGLATGSNGWPRWPGVE
jgi:methylated-DNA-[protein]-cysteine S-methyltransferase